MKWLFQSVLKDGDPKNLTIYPKYCVQENHFIRIAAAIQYSLNLNCSPRECMLPSTDNDQNNVLSNDLGRI